MFGLCLSLEGFISDYSDTSLQVVMRPIQVRHPYQLQNYKSGSRTILKYTLHMLYDIRLGI